MPLPLDRLAVFVSGWRPFVGWTCGGAHSTKPYLSRIPIVTANADQVLNGRIQPRPFLFCRKIATDGNPFHFLRHLLTL